MDLETDLQFPLPNKASADSCKDLAKASCYSDWQWTDLQERDARRVVFYAVLSTDSWNFSSFDPKQCNCSHQIILLKPANSFLLSKNLTLLVFFSFQWQKKSHFAYKQSINMPISEYPINLISTTFVFLPLANIYIWLIYISIKISTYFSYICIYI